MAKKTQSKNGMKLWVRIMALLLCLLMVLSASYYVIYFVFLDGKAAPTLSLTKNTLEETEV